MAKHLPTENPEGPLICTGKWRISEATRKLLAGYAVRINRRYGRQGHLFQNRYKSILYEEDPHFLELTLYIHLSPIRGEWSRRRDNWLFFHGRGMR